MRTCARAAGLAATWLVAATGLAASAWAAVPTGVPPPLRFVTLNLLHGGAASGLAGSAQELEQRLEIVVDSLRALGADVIALQEASVSRGRGNVAARIAAALGFHHVHTPATERALGSVAVGRVLVWLLNFSEGPAIVSRFPIAAWETHDLPRRRGLFDARVLLRTEIEAPWGRFQVFSAHASRDGCQAARVGDLVRSRRAAAPAVLMGDFNAAEGSAAIAGLTGRVGLIDVFRTANPAEPGFTVWQRIEAPAPTVFRRVDYVLLLPGTAFPGRIRASRVVLDTPRRLPDGRVLWPSDHYGVLADIEMFPDRPD
jgi:endonuclease/exonuclease/phosphatase family metal-dependent hydrolase